MVAVIGLHQEMGAEVKTLASAAGLEVLSFPGMVAFLADERRSACSVVVLGVDTEAAETDGQLAVLRQHDAGLAVAAAGSRLPVATLTRLMRAGLLDYLVLPAPARTVAAWLVACRDLAQDRRTVRHKELEDLYHEVESHQILNWRLMYANKEIIQTEQLLKEMATAIRRSGGYEWLELLVDKAEPAGENRLTVPAEIFGHMVESARIQHEFFDFMIFLSQLNGMRFDRAEQSLGDFVAGVRRMTGELAAELGARYARQFKTAFPDPAAILDGYVCQDMTVLARCMRELVANAIKYSPPETPLVIGIDIDGESRMPILHLWIRNTSRPCRIGEGDGEEIHGIPVRYSEQVFDLFYTLGPHQDRLPEEEWTNGTGLYIVRKLLKSQGGWIAAANGTDHSANNHAGGKPVPFTRLDISLPIHAKRDYSRCNPKCSPCPFVQLRAGS